MICIWYLTFKFFPQFRKKRTLLWAKYVTFINKFIYDFNARCGSFVLHVNQSKPLQIPSILQCRKQITSQATALASYAIASMELYPFARNFPACWRLVGIFLSPFKRRRWDECWPLASTLASVEVFWRNFAPLKVASPSGDHHWYGKHPQFVVRQGRSPLVPKINCIWASAD